MSELNIDRIKFLQIRAFLPMRPIQSLFYGVLLHHQVMYAFEPMGFARDVVNLLKPLEGH